MLSKAASGYTVAEVESALRGDSGVQEFRWRLELRDKERNVINDDLGTLEDGSLDWVRNRRIRGGGQLKFIKRDLNLDSYADLVLASSPLFYLRLGDASGTTAEDASPNNRDGAYVNTPTLDVSSLLKSDSANGAVTFNGTDESVTIAHDAAFNFAAFTAEAWIKTTSTSGRKVIVARDDTVTDRMFAFRIQGAEGNETGCANLSLFFGATQVQFPAIGANMTDGLEYYVAATYDGAHVRIYVDGVQVLKTAETRSLNSMTEQVQIGVQGALNWFNGTLDEVAVYGAALPAAVIRSHYLAGANKTQEINFTSDRIKLFLQMKMEDGGYAEWARGEYLLGFPIVRETETGTRYEVLIFDKVKLLDDYKFTDRYVIASGTLYTTAMNDLLALVYLPGEYSVSTTSTKTLPAAMSFQVGENLLDAVNKLATAINYGSAYPNADGDIILEEYVAPVSRAVDDIWDVDNGQSFLSWERETSNNYNDTFNVVVAKSVSSKNGTITRAIAKNTNASHPTNITTGIRTFVYEVQAVDSGTLQSIADRKLLELIAPAETFVTESVMQGWWENDEKVKRIEDGESTDYYFLGRRTSLSGKPPFMEGYILTKCYPV